MRSNSLPWCVHIHSSKRFTLESYTTTYKILGPTLYELWSCRRGGMEIGLTPIIYRCSCDQQYLLQLASTDRVLQIESHLCWYICELVYISSSHIQWNISRLELWWKLLNLKSHTSIVQLTLCESCNLHSNFNVHN